MRNKHKLPIPSEQNPPMKLEDGSFYEEKVCEWTYTDDTFFDGHWHTSCKNDFSISNDDTPKENGFKFCCYCGYKIKEK